MGGAGGPAEAGGPAAAADRLPDRLAQAGAAPIEDNARGDVHGAAAEVERGRQSLRVGADHWGNAGHPSGPAGVAALERVVETVASRLGGGVAALLLLTRACMRCHPPPDYSCPCLLRAEYHPDLLPSATVVALFPFQLEWSVSTFNSAALHDRSLRGGCRPECPSEPMQGSN